MTSAPTTPMDNPALLSNVQWITQRLGHAFPQALIIVHDPRGDDQHLALHITSGAFSGKTRVQCHQMVYAVLQDLRGGRLHALSLKTSISATP